MFLASLAIPYIPPKTFPLLSVLSLAMPLLILLLTFFLAYWILIGFKKQFLLSTFMIALAIILKIFPYKFKDESVPDANGLKIMSFNVRMLNRYDWLDAKDIPEEISNFILNEQPDIVCIQEFYNSDRFKINYPYNFLQLDQKKGKTGLVLYSKFPIYKKGSLNFKNTHNNTIFADILYKNDTIRIYNVHLETTGIKPNPEFFEKRGSERVFKRIAKAFTKQQEQVEMIEASKTESPYKIVVCGDFNNTAYSWAYRKIKGNLTDTFLAAGTGFGKTYDFNGYPLRIDFILTDPLFKVKSHQNYEVHFSDHFPITAVIQTQADRKKP